MCWASYASRGPRSQAGAVAPRPRQPSLRFLDARQEPTRAARLMGASSSGPPRCRAGRAGLLSKGRPLPHEGRPAKLSTTAKTRGQEARPGPGAELSRAFAERPSQQRARPGTRPHSSRSEARRPVTQSLCRRRPGWPPIPPKAPVTPPRGRRGSVARYRQDPRVPASPPRDHPLRLGPASPCAPVAPKGTSPAPESTSACVAAVSSWTASCASEPWADALWLRTTSAARTSAA